MSIFTAKGKFLMSPEAATIMTKCLIPMGVGTTMWTWIGENHESIAALCSIGFLLLATLTFIRGKKA